MKDNHPFLKATIGAIGVIFILPLAPWILPVALIITVLGFVISPFLRDEKEVKKTSVMNNGNNVIDLVSEQVKNDEHHPSGDCEG
ncbi:hypothetical protein AB4090_05985 [Acidithiobacillus sp. IBUN Pt1247-S3]|uniref:hypothetical protein n=1 Tax=Acidithiobacillus sp. IBUN Pt1247-S3 TaxID=3166642 RepID=UPI0034E603C5